MSFLSSAWSWIRGGSLAANLVQTAVIAYGMSKLSNSLSKSSNKSHKEKDKGQQVQLDPDTTSKIPVLYGNAFFAGMITDVELTSNYKTMRYCLTLCETTGTKLSTNELTSYTFNDAYVNNNRIIFKEDGYTVDYTLDSAGNQDISMRDLVKVYMYEGQNPLQPDSYTGITPPASTVMAHWTPTDNTMPGLVYAIIEVTYNRAKNVTGIPSFRFEMTSSMTKPGDVLYDYMTNERYGANLSTSEINTTSLTQLNSYSDTGFTFTLPNGSASTSKYGINGLINTNDNVLSNMEEIADSANSWLSFDVATGKWNVIINQLSASVASFDDSNIVGSISIGSTALAQLNSVAEVEYQNATIQNKADFVRVTLPESALLANEPETILSIKLPFVNRQALAIKLGLQFLKQGRVDKTINFTTDYSYMDLKAGDVISVTSDIFSYTNKQFRITEVEEIDGEDGEILINFSCLEYDADVYAYDITEYTVETNDGLLNIGTIGTPGTPQYSKIESDRRPRIQFECISPSGVVEALEFWVTNDVTEIEDDRLYRLLSTRYPTELGTETWAEGTNVVYEDDTLTEGDFLVKARGINTIVAGPFSAPSGMIEYKPQQTTDVVGPDTSAMDTLGQIMGAITLLELLGKAFDLFGEGSEDKSWFESIFDIFHEETGVDLVGDASDGTLVVASQLAIDLEGSEIIANPTRLNFSGQRVDAELTGTEVTIFIDNDFEPNMAPKKGQTLAWDGENWTAADCCCDIEFGDILSSEFTLECDISAKGCVKDPTPICEVSLSGGAILPPDRATWKEQGQLYKPSTVTAKGSYWMRYSFEALDCDGNFASSHLIELEPGDGSVYLYKSDGTLVETLTSGDIKIDIDLVELPFATREYGTDYYILVDENLVKYCDAKSEAISSPREWNFCTAPYYLDEYKDPDHIITDFFETSEGRFPVYSTKIYGQEKLYGTGLTPGVAYACGTDVGFELRFCEDVEPNIASPSFGKIIITGGPNEVKLDVGDATITGNIVTWPKADITKMLEANTTYTVTVPTNVVKTKRTANSIWMCGHQYTEQEQPEQVTNEAFDFEVSFVHIRKLEAIKAVVSTGTDDTFDYNKLDLIPEGNIRTNVAIAFNRLGVKITDTPPGLIKLYKGNGELVQTFDVFEEFDPDYVSDLWHQFSVNVDENIHEWEPEVDVVQINPTQILKRGTEYYVLIDANVIDDDLCTKDFPGVTDPFQIRFKTDEVEIMEADYTQPNDLAMSDTLIEIPVDKHMKPGSGVVVVKDSLGNVVKTISSGSSVVNIV